MTERSATGIAGWIRCAIAYLEKIPLWIPEIFLRCGIALVFWRSGQTKLQSWDTTIMLFENEYPVPILPPTLSAYIATGVEIAGPIMLLVGLGARWAALAMFGMTVVIQLFIYPTSYPDHLLWAGPLLYLIVRGPGVLSIDHLIRKKFGG